MGIFRFGWNVCVLEGSLCFRTECYSTVNNAEALVNLFIEKLLAKFFQLVIAAIGRR